MSDFDAVKAIEDLVKALEAGGYDVAPSSLGGPLEKKDDRYPHKCPWCHCPAYVGFNSVDCKAKCK